MVIYGYDEPGNSQTNTHTAAPRLGACLLQVHPQGPGPYLLKGKEMKVEIKNNEIIVTLPISKQPSKTGKTLVIASTHGNQASTAVIDGQAVIVGCNCYIRKPV